MYKIVQRSQRKAREQILLVLFPSKLIQYFECFAEGLSFK